MLQATPELLAKLKAFPGVRSVNLTLERQALVTTNNQTRGALVRGVRPEDLQTKDMVSRTMVHGELSAFGTRPGVLIGERLRQALSLRAGDKLTLVTHRVNDNGTIAPRYSDYEVLGAS
jgi:lipoprotein-releasing system permease protein